MSRHTKTQAIIDVARAILAETNPMTLRQLFYQLLGRQVLKNCRASYQALSNAIVQARKDGSISWEWIEDRLRQPRAVSMWGNLADFADSAMSSYRLDVWATQPGYVEAWVEKDALSGVFEDVLEHYGVTLNVGRGYDGWSSIHNAAERYSQFEDVTVLYFGDLDPSGEDMVRSLRDRLAELGCRPEIIKCALTAEDVARYELPPAYTKTSDTRARAFIQQHGECSSVELDALPVEVLRDRIKTEVEKRMDLDALALVREQEEDDRRELSEALGIGGTEGAL